MTIYRAAVGLFLGLGLAVPQAQAQTCNATVSKRTVVESETREKTWDILFDVAAPACDNSRGQFDFVVELDGGGGRVVLDKASGEFTTENGQRTAVKVSYKAKPGQEVKNVSGVSVKSCTCVKPGN